MSNRLVYEIDGGRTELSMPTTFSECDGEQLIAVAEACLGKLSDDDALNRIAGMPYEVISALTPYQHFKIVEALEPLFDITPQMLTFKEWKIPEIVLGEKTFYGPENSFGNVTWGEFIYVDQCMMAGMHQAAIAAMFRPERSPWDGETDRRIPFTVPGTKNRFSLFNDMEEAIKLAIVWNYRAVKTASVEAVYPAIFPYYDPDAKPQEDDEDPGASKEETPSSFSWINVHRDLLGDNIQDEDKFLNLPMHTVLYRINARIVENRQRKSTSRTE